MDVIEISTHSRTEMIDINRQVTDCIRKSGVKAGLCILYVPHTTAAITINEGADPSVKKDILDMLDHLIPFDAHYAHTEGNSAAHIKSTIVGVTQIIPVKEGTPALGTWQTIFFCEFDGPRRRRVHVTVSGSA